MSTPTMHPASDVRGFTLIELLIVVAMVGILTAMSVPSLMRTRIAAAEASAVGSMRSIVSAEQDFVSLSGGFADDLVTLASACPGMLIGFLSPDLNANGITKSGYRYEVTAGRGSDPGPPDCFGNPTQTSYYASAEPLFPGGRGFAANTTGSVWQDTTGALPAEPFAFTATVTPIGR